MKIILKYPLLTGILPSLCVNSFASRGMGSVASNQLWMGPRTMRMLSRFICRASGLANLEAVSTLVAVKFKQEETLIPHLIRMGIDIPANLLGAYVIPRIGVWKAIFGGYFFHVILGLLSDMWPIWLMVRLTRAASRALLSGCGVGAGGPLREMDGGTGREFGVVQNLDGKDLPRLNHSRPLVWKRGRCAAHLFASVSRFV